MADIMRCPHCDKDISVKVEFMEARSGARGQKPVDFGPEIDSFVIDVIDRQKISFNKLAQMLEEKGILTAAGKSNWQRGQARRLYRYAVDRKKKKIKDSTN